MDRGEDIKVPITAMQLAEDVEQYQQDLTALGIMPSDPFQLEAAYGDDAPQLVAVTNSEDAASEDMAAMPDLQSGNADLMPADELLPLGDCSSGFGHKCTVCGKRFLSSTWLDKHMAMHVKSEQYSCDKCGAVFSRKNSLYYHQLKEHSNKGPRAVSCKICGKTVGVGGPLTNHLRSHTLSAAHSAAQQYKKKLLKSKISNLKPQEILKRNVRSLLKCNFCGKTFQRVSSLSNHLRVHTNVKIPNKKLSVPKAVVEDSEASNTEKLLKFQCHICNRRLVNNIALSNHLRSHGLTLALKFKKGKRDMTLMAFHQRTFGTARKFHYSKTSVERKQASATDITKKVDKSKPTSGPKPYVYNPRKIYKCKYCGLQFNNKFGMAGHVKAHKAEFGQLPKSGNNSKDNFQIQVSASDTISGDSSSRILVPSHDGNEFFSQPYGPDENISELRGQLFTPHEDVTNFLSNQYTPDEDEAQFDNSQHVPPNTVTEFSNEKLVQETNVANELPPAGSPVVDTNIDDFTNVAGADMDEFTNPSILSVKCKLCGVEFDNGVSLALHSRKHKRGKNVAATQDTFKCMECFTIVASRSGLMRHTLMHTGTRMHNCPECGIRFLQKIHLQRHLSAHQNKFPFKCDVCTATYIEARGMLKHKRMHDDPNWGFVTCAHCKFVFTNSAVLKTHIRARHTGKQSFECNVCQAQFMKNTHLNQHLKLHDVQVKHSGDHRNRVSTFASPRAPKSYPLKKGKSQKKLICEFCKHSFGYKCSLKVHMRKIHHHFYCGICLTFVHNRYMSNASGMLHNSVCISCYPGKGKKRKGNKASNVSDFSLQVQELLSELVDEELLQSEGVLEKPIEQQLNAMIQLCRDKTEGNRQSTGEETLEENVKYLFALCIGEEATNTLLQSESVDVVICGMLSSLRGA